LGCYWCVLRVVCVCMCVCVDVLCLYFYWNEAHNCHVISSNLVSCLIFKHENEDYKNIKLFEHLKPGTFPLFPKSKSFNMTVSSNNQTWKFKFISFNVIQECLSMIN
jgi:hypothetical protein